MLRRGRGTRLSASAGRDGLDGILVDSCGWSLLNTQPSVHVHQGEVDKPRREGNVGSVKNETHPRSVRDILHSPPRPSSRCRVGKDLAARRRDSNTRDSLSNPQSSDCSQSQSARRHLGHESRTRGDCVLIAYAGRGNAGRTASCGLHRRNLLLVEV